MLCTQSPICNVQEAKVDDIMNLCKFYRIVFVLPALELS